jgi:hypothetical protein
VLAPPGGSCSNIFGWEAESKAEPVVAQQPAPVHELRNESTVFRSPLRENPSSDRTDAALIRGKSSVFSESPAAQPERSYHQKAAFRQQQSSVFENEYEPPAPQQQKQQPAAPQQQAPAVSGYKAPLVHASVGAHTGDALMSGYALGRNSSRVLQPPGGRCSNIFG